MQLKKTDIYFSFKLKACMTENHNYAVHTDKLLGRAVASN